MGASPIDEKPLKSTLAGLEVVCFGPPTVLLAGQPPPPDVLWRKHLGLLVYLSLATDHTKSRDHLLGLLWPEKSEARARHSLNEAVRRLRTALGPERLVTRGDQLILEREGLVVDALEFDQAARSDPERALSGLKGDFLEGFSLDNAPEFDTWVARQRDHYRTRGAELLVDQGERELNRNEFRRARETARRALALHPYFEPGARLLMRTLALSGDSSGALAASHGFAERLSRDLGESPGRSYQALVDRIRRESWRAIPRSPEVEEPKLTGRIPVYEAVFGQIQRAFSQGPVAVVVTGEPGTGKTRLLTEMLDRASLTGAMSALTQPLESDHDAPWSTLRSLMRAGLLNAPGIAATDPDRLSLLASIVPELADRVKSRTPKDNAQVAEAFRSLLDSISDETPVALGLDDAHLSDGPSLEALTSCLARLRARPVLLVVTSPDQPTHLSRELLRLQSEIGRGIPGSIEHLDSLTDEEVAQLTREMAGWSEDEGEIDRLARRVAYESGGNPLLAVELLRGFGQVARLRDDLVHFPNMNATLESPLPISVPNLVRRSIVARVIGLDERAKKVLTAASIGGQALDLGLIGSLTGMSNEEVEQSLAVLERGHFIRFDGDRYAFAAQIVTEVISTEMLVPGERRRLEEGAIDVLATRSDLESKVLRAQLVSELHPGAEAFDLALEAAREALSAGSMRAAKRAMVAGEKSEQEVSKSRRSALARLKKKLRR